MKIDKDENVINQKIKDIKSRLKTEMAELEQAMSIFNLIDVVGGTSQDKIEKEMSIAASRIYAYKLILGLI